MRIRDPRASAVKMIRPETVTLLADLFQRNSGHDRQTLYITGLGNDRGTYGRNLICTKLDLCQLKHPPLQKLKLVLTVLLFIFYL